MPTGKERTGDASYPKPRVRVCKVCLYQSQMIRWNRRKAEAVQYLGGRCVRCGLTGHPVLFDFDHRDPTGKLFGWNKLRLRSWDAVRRELDKCDLLCAPCHRLRHLNPALWPDQTDPAAAAAH